ncbi:DUF4012 domain-containing protein [Candidatus Gottesmanbacteria bacterium]|nr:DUF4012 domain-containing protein [Candidatus Gottesmanbacteria bacterium]
MTFPATSDDKQHVLFSARLDSQDVIFSHVLREYLSARGTDIVENYQSPVRTHYHVVCGDSQYVKTILKRFGDSSDRVLVISWDESTKTNPKIGGTHVKLVLTDRDKLTEDVVKTILDFFFTGSSPLMDIRRKGGQRSTRHHDKERIAGLIDSIYEKEIPRHYKGERWRMRWGRLIVFFIILPFFWYTSSLSVSVISYGATIMFLRYGDSETAVKAATIGRESARTGRALVTIFESRAQEQFFQMLVDMGSLLARLGMVTDQAKRWGASVVSDQGASGIHPAVAADSLRAQVGAIVTTIGLVEASYNELMGRGVFPLSLLSIGHYDEVVRGRIGETRELLTTVDRLLLLYKEAGGFNGAQTYLVLFQNSMELRPTGGFIGSVGKLTMVDGKIGELVIFDVYELDGQLRGHVDPPDPIRTLLAQEHWYLRDSNWDPDFTLSGAKAAWFFEKETGQTVDGVFALTTGFVTEFLKATGPITLSDYSDRVTSDNFLGKALYYTKSGFFPGSTQKKDFLGSLARAMFERSHERNGINTTIAMRSIIGSVDRHDVQFYFADPTRERLVRAFSWAGELDAGASGDLPLAIVDANVGVNKANVFIANDIGRDIEILENGTVSETVTFSQSNSGGSTGEDANYASYTRFYLSPDANVQTVTIDSEVIGEGSSGTLPYWEEGNEHGRVVVGVASILAAKKNRRIAVTYTRPITIASGERVILTTRSQAGTPEAPLSLRVRAPAPWLMTLAEGSSRSQLVASRSLLEYNTTLSSDWRLILQFTQ